MQRDLKTGLENVVYSVSLGSSLIRYGALSPDGQELALVIEARGTGSRALIVVPVRGGEPRQILKGNIHHQAGLAWTPDGREILFARYTVTGDLGVEELTTEPWRVSAEGGEPQRLELGMDNPRHITMHPDGQHIAFTAGERKIEVWVMENFLPELSSTE